MILSLLVVTSVELSVDRAEHVSNMLPCASTYLCKPPAQTKKTTNERSVTLLNLELGYNDKMYHNYVSEKNCSFLVKRIIKICESNTLVAAEFNALPIENGDDFLWGNIFFQRKGKRSPFTTSLAPPKRRPTRRDWKLGSGNQTAAQFGTSRRPFSFCTPVGFIAAILFPISSVEGVKRHGNIIPYTHKKRMQISFAEKSNKPMFN